MQRRQSSTESRRISRPPNPGLQNNYRRAVSEQRPPKSRARHIVEDSLSKVSTFNSQERQDIRTRPSINRFQASPKTSPLLTRKVVPPSRAPSSYAQVELRKKLLEENIKLAKSLSGLKKHGSLSRNGWETVWRNRAILDNFFGYDWDTNPRLHKRNSKTLAADIGKESATARSNLVQEDDTNLASVPTTSNISNRVLQPIAESSESTINHADEANECLISCSCDKEGEPLKEIQDWMKKELKCAFRFGTSQLDLNASIARVGQSAATTDPGCNNDLAAEDQLTHEEPQVVEAIPLRRKYASRITEGDADPIKVDSAEVSLSNMTNETLHSSPEVSKIAVISYKNLTDVQSMDSTQTIDSMKKPTEECKVEELMLAELLNTNFSQRDLTFSEKAALKVIEYQSQQIKALMKIAQQKPSHLMKSDDVPKKPEGTVSKSLASYWNEARLLSWAKECKVRHQAEVFNETDSMASIGSSIPSAVDTDIILPITSTATPSVKLETLDSLDSPNSLVGVSIHDLIPSDISFPESVNRNFTNKLEHEMLKPATVASSDEPLESRRSSLDLASIKISESPSRVTANVKVDLDTAAHVDINVNFSQKVSNGNSCDKASPAGEPTEDLSAVLDFCASNDDTTAASTGTTPTVRSTLVVNSSSQTLAQAKDQSTLDASKYDHGILLETFSQGNFLYNIDVFDDGSDETKSLDGQGPATANNQLTAIIHSRKKCKARRIRRRVSFSNRVALCPAQALINGQDSPVSKDLTQEHERKLQLSFRYPQNSHSVGCLGK